MKTKAKTNSTMGPVFSELIPYKAQSKIPLTLYQVIPKSRLEHLVHDEDSFNGLDGRNQQSVVELHVKLQTPPPTNPVIEKKQKIFPPQQYDIHVVNYSHKEGKEGLGRLIASDYNFSMQGMSKELRHTLCTPSDKPLQRTCIDIDIKNSYGVIELQFCQIYNIPHTHLKQYVNHRRQKLKEVSQIYKVSEAVAKNLFLVIMFGGTLETWKKKHHIDSTAKLPNFVEQYMKEQEQIRSFVYANDAFKYEKQVIQKYQKQKKKSTKKSPSASLLSSLLGTIESYIMQHVGSYFMKTPGFELSQAYIYDGQMQSLKRELI